MVADLLRTRCTQSWCSEGALSTAEIRHKHVPSSHCHRTDHTLLRRSTTPRLRISFDKAIGDLKKSTSAEVASQTSNFSHDSGGQSSQCSPRLPSPIVDHKIRSDSGIFSPQRSADSKSESVSFRPSPFRFQILAIFATSRRSCSVDKNENKTSKGRASDQAHDGHEEGTEGKMQEEK